MRKHSAHMHSPTRFLLILFTFFLFSSSFFLFLPHTPLKIIFTFVVALINSNPLKKSHCGVFVSLSRTVWMTGTEINLTDAERYSLWCEEVRMLFGVATNDEVRHAKCGEGGQCIDEEYFPYCFYMRMLGALCQKENSGDALNASGDGNLSSRSSESRESCFSSVSQQQAYLDEDALASRLTVKLQAFLRTLKRDKKKEEERTQSSRLEGANLWSFRDATVEAQWAAVNEELHELFMYARRRNLLSQRVRHQLQQTRQLILMQRPSSI
ncbi:hypothetical protein TRVL_07498 [Trypanosoma vivax]|nr:hypothetical protein TRVL_07498 [Trypanosoma vivax]